MNADWSMMQTDLLYTICINSGKYPTLTLFAFLFFTSCMIAGTNNALPTWSAKPTPPKILNPSLISASSCSRFEPSCASSNSTPVLHCSPRLPIDVGLPSIVILWSSTNVAVTLALPALHRRTPLPCHGVSMIVIPSPNRISSRSPTASSRSRLLAKMVPHHSSPI